MKNEIRYIDLFAGVGGFRLGIQRAFQQVPMSQKRQEEIGSSRDVNIQTRRSDGCSGQPSKTNCVFTSEIDKYAIQTYNKNFGTNLKPNDITKVKADSIPDFDLLCGGFPCQAFSIAGKRRGFEDTRGTMFYEIARILKVKKPKYFLLENVKGLLSHDSGRTFAIILTTLSELGYDVQWMVLNSKFFGVPQNRERVFIIGNLGGTSRPEILPFGETEPENNGCEGRKGEISSTRQGLQSEDGQTKSSSGDTRFDSTSDENILIHNINVINRPKYSEGDGFEMNKRVYGSDGVSPTLQSGESEVKVMMTQVHNMQPRSPDRPSLKYSSGGSGHLQREDTAWCLDGGNTNAVEFNNMRIRRLTPIECERLQGFPDNWTEGVSDTQRYKQMGNAVTVNVVEALIKRIFGDISRQQSQDSTKEKSE